MGSPLGCTCCGVNMTVTAERECGAKVCRQRTAEFRALDMRDARRDWRAIGARLRRQQDAQRRVPRAGNARTTSDDQTTTEGRSAVAAGPLQRPVGRLAPERRADGMPASADEPPTPLAGAARWHAAHLLRRRRALCRNTASALTSCASSRPTSTPLRALNVARFEVRRTADTAGLRTPDGCADAWMPRRGLPNTHNAQVEPTAEAAGRSGSARIRRVRRPADDERTVIRR